MKPGSRTKREWHPRKVPLDKLYADNVRLQKLNVVHRQQIRGMQKTLQLYRLIIAQQLDYLAREKGSTLAYQKAVAEKVGLAVSSVAVEPAEHNCKPECREDAHVAAAMAGFNGA